MTRVINGKFTIKATPRAPDDALDNIGARSTQFEKSFQGPMEARSLVIMIGVMNQELASGGYVAMERVSGSIEGRHGSFLLQHASTMNRGVPLQSIMVVPDSGTEALKGLRGHMSVDIADGQHFYNFSYDIEPNAH